MIQDQQALKRFNNIPLKCDQYVSNFSLNTSIAFLKEEEIKQKVISVCMKEVQISLSATYANMPVPTGAISDDSEPRYCRPFPARTDHCTSIAFLVNASILSFSLKVSVSPYKPYSPDVQYLGKAKFSANNVPCHCPLLVTRNLNLG